MAKLYIPKTDDEIIFAVKEDVKKSRIGQLAGAVLSAETRDALVDAIFLYMNNNLSQWGINKINQELSRKGVDLQFTSTNKDQIVDDVDGFAARTLNSKIGTTLTGVRGLTKDEVLQNVGAAMAVRINSEAGTTLTNIFPVSEFRRQIGNSIVSQLDENTNNAGAMLTRQGIAGIKGAVALKIEQYRPASLAPSTSTPEQRAANRARQAKYRRTHEQIWVTRVTT